MLFLEILSHAELADLRANVSWHRFPYTLPCADAIARPEERGSGEAFDVGMKMTGVRVTNRTSQSVPVVRQNATRPFDPFVDAVGLIRLGEDAKAGYKMINAGPRRLREACFSRPLLSRRCLIPADGFYEWSKFSKGSSSLYPRGRLNLCVRWNLGPMEEPGAKVGRNVFDYYDFGELLLSDIHDRMPVILKSEDHDRWLDPGFSKSMTSSICSNHTNEFHAPIQREFSRQFS